MLAKDQIINLPSSLTKNNRLFLQSDCDGHGMSGGIDCGEGDEPICPTQCDQEPPDPYCGECGVDSMQGGCQAFCEESEDEPVFIGVGTLRIDKVGPNWVRVDIEEVHDADGNLANGYRIYCEKVNRQTLEVIEQIEVKEVPDSGLHTFENLKPGYYVFYYKAYNSDMTSEESNKEYATVIEKWDWSKSNGPKQYASPEQTSHAYWATQDPSQKIEIEFSYKVWNDICEKINEIREAIGQPWTSEQGRTLEQTKMEDDDRLITKSRFNSALANISSTARKVGFVHSPDEGVPGNSHIIYGSLFTGLTDSINAWIDEF